MKEWALFSRVLLIIAFIRTMLCKCVTNCRCVTISLFDANKKMEGKFHNYVVHTFA